MPKHGIDGGVYRDTGSNWDSPTWSDCDLISDCTPMEEWDVFEFTVRRSRAKFGEPTVKGIAVTVKMLRDPGDANYVAFRNACAERTALHLLILDGKKETEGSEGHRAWYKVTKANASQNTGDVLFSEYNLTPMLSSETDEIPQTAVVGALEAITYTDI